MVNIKVMMMMMVMTDDDDRSFNQLPMQGNTAKLLTVMPLEMKTIFTV